MKCTEKVILCIFFAQYSQYSKTGEKVQKSNFWNFQIKRFFEFSRQKINFKREMDSKGSFLARKFNFFDENSILYRIYGAKIQN